MAHFIKNLNRNKAYTCGSTIWFFVSSRDASSVGEVPPGPKMQVVSKTLYAGTITSGASVFKECFVLVLNMWDSNTPDLQEMRWVVPGLQSQLVRSLETT